MFFFYKNDRIKITLQLFSTLQHTKAHNEISKDKIHFPVISEFNTLMSFVSYDTQTQKFISPLSKVKLLYNTIKSKWGGFYAF
jgi:hypothetical protein